MAAPTDTALTLAGPAGAVEAVLSAADGPAVGVAIVCHPHPLHDGTMHNKVAHTLARAFANRGIPALRFKFRGVGASAGASSGGTTGPRGMLPKCFRTSAFAAATSTSPTIESTALLGA